MGISIKPSCICFLITLMFVSSCQSDKTAPVKDSFESDSVSSIWRKDKYIKGALEIQSARVRSGQKAVKLTLKPGDQISEEKGTIYERAELREPKELMSVEHQKYSYSFSLLLPGDFPIVPTRLVIAQWKQNCEDENCDPNNPVIALRFESGVFRITLQTGPERTTLYSRTETVLDKWQDFRFSIRFSRSVDGQIQAWLNNKEIIDYKGVTAYSEEYGYPHPGNFYFKFGLYRDQMDQPMIIYIDDYLKQQLKAP
jgi:hypothetical protein